MSVSREEALALEIKSFEDIKKGDEFIFDNKKMVVSKTLIVGTMKLVETNDDLQYIYNGCEKDFKWVINPQLSDDVESALEDWYERTGLYLTNFDKLFNTIKQHIQAQDNCIKELEEEKKNYNNSNNTLDFLIDEQIDMLIKSKNKALDKVNAIKEVLNNMKIDYDESGMMATTTHPYSTQEMKERFFKPLDEILNNE